MFCALRSQVKLTTASLVLAVAALALLVLSCNRRPPEASQVNVSAGPSPLRDSTGTPSTVSSDGENNAGYGWTTPGERRRKLADYAGQVVVLDFYATWCEPCREETPHLVALQKRFESQGLRIVGLNVGGADDIEKVPEFAREFGIQYPLAVPDAEFTDKYMSGYDSIPQALIFDRSGRLVKRFVGYNDIQAAELEQVVQSTLAAGAN